MLKSVSVNEEESNIKLKKMLAGSNLQMTRTKLHMLN